LDAEIQHAASGSGKKDKKFISCRFAWQASEFSFAALR
jgi:hypothetical protein